MRRRSLVSMLALAGMAAMPLMGCAAAPATTGNTTTTTPAPRGAPSGFAVGVHIAPTIFADDYSEDSGSGMGLSVDYGFGPRGSVFMGLDGASMDGGLDVSHFDLGLRYRWDRPGKTFVPYAFAAYSHRSLSGQFNDGMFGETYTYDSSGGGLSVGYGFQVFVMTPFAVDLAYATTLGNFSGGVSSTDPMAEETAFGMTGRLMLGASWYPQRGGTRSSGPSTIK